MSVNLKEVVSKTGVSRLTATFISIRFERGCRQSACANSSPLSGDAIVHTNSDQRLGNVLGTLQLTTRTSRAPDNAGRGDAYPFPLAHRTPSGAERDCTRITDIWRCSLAHSAGAALKQIHPTPVFQNRSNNTDLKCPCLRPRPCEPSLARERRAPSKRKPNGVQARSFLTH